MGRNPSEVGLKIIAMLKSGWHPNRIEKLLGVDGSRIFYWRRKMGMPTFKRGRKALNQTVKMVRLLKSGHRPSEIRRRLKILPSSFSYWRGQLGIPKFPRGPEPGAWNLSRERQVAALKKNGMSFRMIGDKFGISKARAEQILKPERHRARMAVTLALKRGEMTRPNRCNQCGRICKPQSHHTDYSKPLLVEWLCNVCHGIAHRKIR